MNYIGHRNTGLAVSVIATTGYMAYNISSVLRMGLPDQYNFALMVGLVFLSVLLGSLAPDLDIESIPSRWTARALVLWWACIYIFPEQTAISTGYLHVLTIIFLVCKIDQHRGITHALILIPALVCLSIYTMNILFAAFAIGLATHCWYCDDISMMRVKNWF